MNTKVDQDGTPPGEDNPSRRHLSVFTLVFVDLVFAPFFFAWSLSPLSSREWYYQGLISGVTGIVGYGIGVLGVPGSALDRSTPHMVAGTPHRPANRRRCGRSRDSGNARDEPAHRSGPGWVVCPTTFGAAYSATSPTTAAATCTPGSTSYSFGRPSPR